MSEKTAATSLSIVEKKPQRPGGCVGIFCQLFDWNRRFAKKKLFSKKLLPPVRLKKSSTKFGGDEKQPKLRLIADENSGGFPQAKKNGGACKVDSEQKHEMRAPGLVARLMGLESMPAVQRDKLKKAPLSGTGSNKGDKFVDGHNRFERQELTVEKGEAKNELRPQKLQKTGMSERKAVTRLEAEALQLKNVLSRSRKHHQKLVSPVKSPRNHSARNVSRLIGAATRILEPGLQRSRSKCALTYSTAAPHPTPSETLMKEASDLAMEKLENSNHFMSTVQNEKSSSCRNCGHLLDIVDFTPNTEEQPPVFSPVSKVANHSCQMGYPRPRLPIFGPVQEKWKYQEISPFCASLAMDNGQPRAGHMSDNKLLKREGQRHWQASSQHGKLPKDVSSSVGLKQKAQGQKQMFQGRDRLLPLRSKIVRPQNSRVSSTAHTTNERRNFVVMNRNLSNDTQLRMPDKMDDCQFDTDKNIGERRLDCLSPVRKRRSMNSLRLNEGHDCVSSTFIKSNSIRPNVISGKNTDGPCTESRLVHLQENLSGDSGKNDSFTFNSPMKQEAGFDAEVKEIRNGNRSSSEVTHKKSVLQENDGNRSSYKSFPLNGDSLGALLEQKLSELTCQEEDESALGDTTTKKTTAMILQELISALTTERSYHQDDSACKLKNQIHLCSDDRQSKMNTSTAFLAKAKSTKNSVGLLHDYEHLSPGSVLEASFSNDSCGSSSLDDSSRHNLCGEVTEFCQEPHALEPDADLLDSTSSSTLGKFYRESVNTLLKNISEVLSSINVADDHLKGCKLSHAKEVILNAEMVFGNAALSGAIVNGAFSIGCFVLNELETLASVMWTNFSSRIGFNDTKEGHQLKGFIFDCVIEYLDSRFSRYSNTGFDAWTRLPLRMKTEMMISDIVEEVGRWAELAGLFPDELIEYEMSHSLGKWTDFELEAFETGVEIGQQILQILVDELVIDCTCCRTSALDVAFRHC